MTLLKFSHITPKAMQGVIITERSGCADGSVNTNTA